MEMTPQNNILYEASNKYDRLRDKTHDILIKLKIKIESSRSNEARQS